MAHSQDDATLNFVTLGMFIVDEIHFKPPKPPETDVLGGAGSWSVIGARLFRPPPASKNISWIVHRGFDFPPKLNRQIESWQTSCNLTDTPERLTTRGWNSYGEDEARAFKYLAPKLRLDQTMLSEEQLMAKCFHLICTPTRCTDLVKGILERRRALNPNKSRPLFVWEPVPDACQPDELDNAMQALKHVDYLSPNHQELAAFFGENARTSNRTEDEERLASWCRVFLHKGFPLGKGAVVVRCGERGCLWVDGSDLQTRTLPAWHRQALPEDDPESSVRVADPTGAGNAFLGGFCAGILDGSEDEKLVPSSKASANPARGLYHAVVCGVVAASFAIEQVGLPVLGHVAGEELWNGDSVARRYEVMKRRIN